MQGSVLWIDVRCLNFQQCPRRGAPLFSMLLYIYNSADSSGAQLIRKDMEWEVCPAKCAVLIYSNKLCGVRKIVLLNVGCPNS